MKASDSTNSLTGLTEIKVEEIVCFICLEEINEKGEPLVDSSLLRTCGCQFKVHPACWNVWMVDKTEYDCPICRKKSLGQAKSPLPPIPPSEWPQESSSFWRRAIYAIVALIIFVASVAMIYELVKS